MVVPSWDGPWQYMVDCCQVGEVVLRHKRRQDTRVIYKYTKGSLKCPDFFRVVKTTFCVEALFVLSGHDHVFEVGDRMFEDEK